MPSVTVLADALKLAVPVASGVRGPRLTARAAPDMTAGTADARVG